MSDFKKIKNKMEHSIAEQSASLFVTQDDSLAALLVKHDIKVRDFVLISYLHDQGSMRIVDLSRAVGIEPGYVTQSLMRLAAAGLVLRDPPVAGNKYHELANLTSRGQSMVSRMNSQL